MVKTVIGDETHLKLIEDRLTRSALPSQVGLVIGKLSSKLDRGFVYDLVPTPPNDAGEPPCSIIDDKSKKKNPSKPKSQSDSSSLFIDTEWVSEHARQVTRMLLGGMKVVGIYIWVNESLFKNSTMTLCQTVKAVAEAASPMVSDGNERLLVHISYSPLRWTSRNCSLAANVTSSSLRPCDFKMGKVFGSLQTFRCTYNFDVRLPIPHEDGLDIKSFSDSLRDEIAVHAKELSGAKALINGKLVADDDLNVSDDFHEVEFLLPLLQDKYLEACNQKEVLGILLFRGSICSLAYLNSKEPVSQALVDIKEDITRSLQSRLEIMCDEGDRDLEPVTDGRQERNNLISSDKPVPYIDLQVQRKQCNLSFPRRVFVPWLEGTYICDYIQSSETMEIKRKKTKTDWEGFQSHVTLYGFLNCGVDDPFPLFRSEQGKDKLGVLKDHCVELMSIEVPTDGSEILEPESEAPTVIASSTTKTFWGIATDYSSAAKSSSNSISKTNKFGNGNNPAHATDFKSMLPVLVIVFSVIIGLVCYIIGI